jgi:TonB-linked SusC/RagA family outer membrane protein
VPHRSVRASAFFITLTLLVPPLAAQQITGRITNQQTGEPLAAVQVFIAGSGIGALSQQNGRYLLLNVPPGTHTLTAERIGYRSVSQQVTVAAGQTAVQDFGLSEQALGLDEIIVTGTPGGTQRRAIGNSVVALQAADVAQNVAVSSVQDLLGGRTPGVQFARVSGNVGTGSPMEIRGTGSFTLGANPLIYVDGVRVNNNFRAGPELGQDKQVNVLNDFNPQDIESIEIIKGPAAATLYGTEASAGVIQIITKRGAQGDAQFELSVRQGLNFLRDPGGKIGTFWSCRGAFSSPCREGTGLVPYEPYAEGNLLLADGTLNSSPFVTEPWPDERLYQYGPSQSYNLGVRGGTEAIRYFLSGNYDRDEGMEWWNLNKATRLRANVSVVFSEKVTFDASTGYVRGFTRFGQPARADGGVWEDLIWGNGYCAPRINQKGDCKRLFIFQEHLPTDIARVEATRSYQRFTGSGTLNFTPSEWLTARAIVGIDEGWDENTALYPLEVVEPVFFRMPIGEITVARPKNSNFSADVSATANFAVTSAITTSTSVGVQYNYKSDTNFQVLGVGLAAPVSRTINQTPSALSTLTYNYTENKSLGAYVQEQVGWNDRVFVTGAVRFDDNSAFGSALDPEIYPKVAATWTVSDETFWAFELVNSLRLRAAWGQAGRQPDTFAGVTRYRVADGPFGTSAFRPVGPGNPEVGPERSTELEMGFDVALFEDERISGEFTWFSRKNDDALLEINLSPSLGLAGSSQRNLGRIDNWGWEAALSSRLYESPDLSLSLDLTGSHVDNEIISLGDFPGNASVKIGYPYPNYFPYRYMVRSAKYDPAGKKVDLYGQKISALCDKGVRLGDTPQHGLVQGGELIDCETKDAETILTGPAYYRYRWSVSPRVSLFNNTLQLHVLADGAYGRWIHDNKNASFSYDNQRITRTEEDPLWVAMDRYNDAQGRTLYDGDFWKLREVGVRYNLPEALFAHIVGDRGSIAFSAREIANLWRRQTHNWGAIMVDPEMADPQVGIVNSSNNRVSPPLSSLNVDLRITF